VKRIWFGAALLAALLLLGIGSAALMEDIHLTQAAQLNHAADLAMSGSWEHAEAVFSEAHKSWDKKSVIVSGLSDHNPMDQIDGIFAQLEIFATMRDVVSFSSSCRYLAKQLEALSKSHSFSFENFF